MRVHLTFLFLVNGIFKKGIRIVSNQPISVYAFNYEPFSADAYRILPIDALSTHYIAVTYGLPRIRTQLACVALRDDTLIRVKLPRLPPVGTTEPVVDVEGIRFHAGESFNVTLTAFEVLSIRSVGDLSGTDITSNDKVSAWSCLLIIHTSRICSLTYYVVLQIACFSGNVRAHVQVGSNDYSRDHLCSQLMPVSTWGISYAVAPSPSGLSGYCKLSFHISYTLYLFRDISSLLGLLFSGYSSRR